MERGRHVEILFGKMPVRTQRSILQSLKEGTLDFVVATSVIEEGVAIPEIGCVINFSVPLTEKSYIQRMGRTGRTTHGSVDHIVLNHSFDAALFFTAVRGVHTMRTLLRGEPTSSDARAPRPLYRKKKLHPDSQGDLFFGFF